VPVPKLSELAAKIAEKPSSAAPAPAPPPPEPKKKKKTTLQRLGEKAKVEALPPLPEKPKIDIAGKTTWEIMLEMGQVPHYMIARKPEWEIAPEKAMVEEINSMNPTYLLKLGEYYNTLEKMGELSEKERFAAQAMRDRVWSENIGDASVDMVSLTQEDRGEIERLTVTKLSGEEIPAMSASNRELAEELYRREHGPMALGKLKGSVFDDDAKVQSEFIKELRPGFDARQEGAPIVGVQTQLSRDALYKRLLWGHARIPLAEMKERQAKAAEWKAAVTAYYPPEYGAVKGYYRPDWKEQSTTLSQQQMINLSPAGLLNTYKIYFIMRSKGELTKGEEYLFSEMERLLNEFQEKGLITITKPRTMPPMAITQERFTDYLKLVNDLFGALPEEAVVKLSRRPESDVVLKVLRSGVAAEEERKTFVKAIDELFEQLPAAEMDKFSDSPKVGLYMRIADQYGEG